MPSKYSKNPITLAYSDVKISFPNRRKSSRTNWPIHLSNSRSREYWTERKSTSIESDFIQAKKVRMKTQVFRLSSRGNSGALSLMELGCLFGSFFLIKKKLVGLIFLTFVR